MIVTSARGQFLKEALLIIWDEAAMACRHVIEALDRTLRDIMGSVHPTLHHVPFGDQMFVLSGDFRQISTVVPRAAITAACINQSNLWQHIKNSSKLRLTAAENERVRLANGIRNPGSLFLLESANSVYQRNALNKHMLAVTNNTLDQYNWYQCVASVAPKGPPKQLVTLNMQFRA